MKQHQYCSQLLSKIFLVNINDFKLKVKKVKDQEILTLAATISAQQSGIMTAEYIQDFGIEDPKDLAAIAMECTKQGEGGTVAHIQNFGRASR